MRNSQSRIPLYLLLVGVIIVGISLIPQYRNKIISFFKKSFSKKVALVTSKNDEVLLLEDFNEIIKTLEQGDPSLQFIAMMPLEEQKKVYMRIIEDYVINTYLIKQYIKENGLDASESYQEEHRRYMNIMENTFNTTIFQKKLNELILVNEEMAEKYYEENKEKLAEFQTPPFALQVPGIEVRAVRMEKDKTENDYAAQLKMNKDVMSLGRYTHATARSMRIMEALESMNDGAVRRVELENGANLAIYRIAKFEGKWAPYKNVSREVQKIIRFKMLEERNHKILTELREKYKITINIDKFNDFMNKKVDDAEEQIEKLERTAQVLSEVEQASQMAEQA